MPPSGTTPLTRRRSARSNRIRSGAKRGYSNYRPIPIVPLVRKIFKNLYFILLLDISPTNSLDDENHLELKYHRRANNYITMGIAKNARM